MPSQKKINFVVRELEEKDLQRGFFETLSNLKSVGELSGDLERSKRILHEIKSNLLYKIFVAVKDDGEVVGATTLLIEQKFIHNGGKAGHIEDVVTHKDFQGMGIGSSVVRKAIEAAKEAGCYKIVLDCSEENVPFYEKLGFRRHEVEMRLGLEKEGKKNN